MFDYKLTDEDAADIVAGYLDSCAADADTDGSWAWHDVAANVSTVVHDRILVGLADFLDGHGETAGAYMRHGMVTPYVFGCRLFGERQIYAGSQDAEGFKLGYAGVSPDQMAALCRAVAAVWVESWAMPVLRYHPAEGFVARRLVWRSDGEGSGRQRVEEW